MATNVAQNAAAALGGTFALTMVTGVNGNITETAAGIPADATALEVQSALNQLNTVGMVSVTRVTVANGYRWLVTFDGCKIVNGRDVCNEGNVTLLIANSTLVTGGNSSSPVVSVRRLVEGKGPGKCSMGGVNGLCMGYVNSLSSAPPYSFLMTMLTPGSPYYVRVRAHNMVGFGYPALSKPEFQVPTFKPPGAPPPVRLVSSTVDSITVEWDFPRVNGGATVMGFELWMDEWAGGAPRLVFDGTDEPTTTTFKIDSSTSFGVVAGRSYRFMVRAVNYCIVAQQNTACLGEFSDTSVFAARYLALPIYI